MLSEPNATWKGIPESLSMSGSTEPSVVARKTVMSRLGSGAEVLPAKVIALSAPKAIPKDMWVRKLAIGLVFVAVWFDYSILFISSRLL